MQLYTKYEFIQLLLPLVFKQKAYQTTEQYYFIALLHIDIIFFAFDNFTFYLLKLKGEILFLKFGPLFSLQSEHGENDTQYSVLFCVAI